MTTEVLSKKTLYAHGTLGMPLAVIGYPLSIWIPAHYSGGLGISLATVGTILMLARLTDVVTDPLIGELSDRWRKGVAATANKLADTSVGSAVFLPGLGLSTGWDYVAMVTGTPDDMATMMDTVRTGALTAALGKAGLESPSTCVTDLHRSHLMVQMQN